MPCNKRIPGSGCAALAGFNRMLSVLGGSDQCIATHPSDMAVAMRALDARVETVDATGKTGVIPIADFHRLPGTTPQIDTNLAAGELITAVTLPPPPPGRQIYRKIRDRASYAFALVSVAAVVDAVGGRIRSARIACGGLAPKPWRVGQAEATLAGAPANASSFDAAATALLEGARDYGSNDFKMALVQIAGCSILPAIGSVEDGAMAVFPGLEELFEGRHFDREIIVLCVRWYLRFKLSFRDLVEMMAERGLSMAHTTIMRWVYHYVPEFERRWNRFARLVGPSWRVDETYVKIRGKWVYLYRAVDRDGKTVDFRLSTRRNVAAAKSFFGKAIRGPRSTPRTITLDGYAASHRAVREMKIDGQLPIDTKLRSSKYLNNLIEQDHRGVKLRIGPMLGFKQFRTAAVTIAGIELLRRIYKGQFNLRGLRLKGKSAPAIWNAVLAAR
jgi:transposase-like protein